MNQLDLGFMNNILSSQVFQTVISGVIIFVAGQILIRFVIEPIQELKKTVGNIAYLLKFYANVYTASQISPQSYWEVTKALREASSELEKIYNTIPFQGFFSFLRTIPSSEEFGRVSENLIRLSNSAGSNQYTVSNADVADKIREDLNIKKLSN